MPRRKPSVVRGILAGAASGVCATLLMDQFQRASAAGQKAMERRQKLADGESPWTIAHEQAFDERKEAAQENSTEVVARKLAEAAGSEIRPAHKKLAGNAVHYSFGTLMGIVYGVTAEMVPEVTAGGGTAFGTVLFLSADELAVPALRLAPPPTQSMPTDHLQHWAAHVVYGGGLELVRSLIERIELGPLEGAASRSR